MNCIRRNDYWLLTTDYYFDGISRIFLIGGIPLNICTLFWESFKTRWFISCNVSVALKTQISIDLKIKKGNRKLNKSVVNDLSSVTCRLLTPPTTNNYTEKSEKASGKKDIVDRCHNSWHKSVTWSEVWSLEKMIFCSHHIRIDNNDNYPMNGRLL